MGFNSASRTVSTLPAILALLLNACSDGEGESGGASVIFDSAISSNQCVATLRVDGTGTINIATIILDYTSVDGGFGEAGENVRCRNLVRDATRSVALNRCDDDCSQGEHREVYIDFAMGQSEDDLVLDAPADIAECLFEGDAESLDRIGARVFFSTKPEGSVPQETIALRVRCDGWPHTTTTTSSSTTTMPCAGETCEEGDVIPVEFRLESPVSLGSLQLNVEFSSTVGAFDQTATPAARCRVAPAFNGLYATRQSPHIDDPECAPCERLLVIGFAFGAGYDGPGTLLTCDFVVGSRLPEASDFEITVVEATDTNFGQPVEPPPVISIRLP
jgi:hypothetical protein